MTQATLFDAAPSAPAPPRCPVEPWLAAELVALGVAQAVAAGYSMRQAFAVRAKLARAGATKLKRGAQGDPDADQVHRDGPNERPRDRTVSALERSVAADEMAAILADARAGTASDDEVYRFLRASLYVLSGAELERVCAGLIILLRAQ